MLSIDMGRRKCWFCVFALEVSMLGAGGCRRWLHAELARVLDTHLFAPPQRPRDISFELRGRSCHPKGSGMDGV